MPECIFCEWNDLPADTEECPDCGKKFDPGSAIDNHIKNVSKQKEDKIRKESENKFKSQIEAKDKEIEKSKKDILIW